MLRTINATCFAALLAATTPVLAQTFYEDEYGPPVIYDPGPAYEPPLVYDPGPPILYDEGPIIYGPPPVEVEVVTPDIVLDDLEAAGYRDFGPMEERGPIYSLSAVSPEGDVVALEVSVATGEIVQEAILRQRSVPQIAEAPRPVIAPARPPAASGPPPSTLRDRLVPPAEGEDPLVVY